MPQLEVHKVACIFSMILAGYIERWHSEVTLSLQRLLVGLVWMEGPSGLSLGSVWLRLLPFSPPNE